jgi:hypothetical protein
MKGLPATSTSDFGTFPVTDLSLVARPPASIATGNIFMIE